MSVQKFLEIKKTKIFEAVEIRLFKQAVIQDKEIKQIRE